ncbi:hypothetical protein [Acinetobacter calcoaceticus]|uniref:hypothetical protein n=1 Tax=Acinetobacter calcoaceticus TaxID=471 RepID=UPI003A8B7BF2
MNKFLISLIFSFLCQCIFANGGINTSLDLESKDMMSLQDKRGLSVENVILLEKIKNQDRDLLQLNQDYQEQKNELDKLSQDYSELKNYVDLQKESGDLISFSSWASFLLTAVAVLVTVLGVMIAIISFIGFKGIKAQAEAIAITAAENQVEIKLDQIAVKEFQRLIDEGALNKQLESAVDMILRLENVSQYDELDKYDESEGEGE